MPKWIGLSANQSPYACLTREQRVMRALEKNVTERTQRERERTFDCNFLPFKRERGKSSRARAVCCLGEREEFVVC